jgi:hypothetical protein
MDLGLAMIHRCPQKGRFQMPFEQETSVGVATGDHFGKYVQTFRSNTGQVVAYFFEQEGWLIAHITRPTGLEIEDVTDPYVTELHQFAKEQGFDNKFRMIYVE